MREEVENLVGYVTTLAQQFCRKRGITNKDDVDDMVSEALLELTLCESDYNPDHGTKFRTFAHQRVSWRLQTLVRKHARQPDILHFDDLADPMYDGEDTPYTSEELMGGIDEDSPYWEALRAEEREIIEEFARNLTNTEFRVLEQLYGIPSREDSSTMDQAAEELGISVGRVRQLRDRAFRKLRNRGLQEALYGDRA